MSESWNYVDNLDVWYHSRIVFDFHGISNVELPCVLYRRL